MEDARKSTVSPLFEKRDDPRGFDETIVFDGAMESTNISVLVFGDDSRVGVVLRRAFSRLDTSVAFLAPHDIHATLAQIHATLPHIVILDVRDAFALGRKIIEAIRNNPQTADMKVVVIYSRIDDRDELLLLGADSALSTPFSSRRIEKLARNLLS